MENIGTWNSDIVFMTVLCFFAPVLFSGLIKLFLTIYIAFSRNAQPVYSSIQEQASHTLDDYFVVHGSELYEPAATEAALTREQQWSLVVDSAMNKAMTGDKSARDWVTKHVFDETTNEKTVPSKKSQKQSSPRTSQDTIKEAYNCLKPLGYKPTELKDKIRDLCKDKIYTSVDDLIQDVIRGA